MIADRTFERPDDAQQLAPVQQLAMRQMHIGEVKSPFNSTTCASRGGTRPGIFETGSASTSGGGSGWGLQTARP